VHILPSVAKALLRLFCNSNYIHLCPHTTFSNSWKLIQSTSKNLSKLVSGEAMTSSVSSWLHYCYLAKMIAYFFIQNCFKCDYVVIIHCSSVSFGNTRITLWLKNVPCLQIRHLMAVANSGVILFSMSRAVELFVYGMGLPHWCFHVPKFNKRVFLA